METINAQFEDEDRDNPIAVQAIGFNALPEEESVDNVAEVKAVSNLSGRVTTSFFVKNPGFYVELGV